MLLKPVKLLLKEQIVLIYYHLLPVEGITIYTQVILYWMYSPPKHSSFSCMWPWDFFSVVLTILMRQIKCLPLILNVRNTSDSLFCYCSCWFVWLEFFRINVQCFAIFSIADSWVWVTVGYSSLYKFSITFFPVLILIVLPLPMKIFLIIQISHFPWFFSTPFIMTTSLMLVFTVFWGVFFHFPSSCFLAFMYISMFLHPAITNFFLFWRINW